ncbi:MAG: ornithine carbamoyltransferase [Phycisphaeraceae bacterium]|nr:ornithine carbamoyltransferase [Phycisphaeraceae bacterium]
MPTMPPTTSPASLKNADLLTLASLDAAQIEELFITAAATKRDIAPYRRALDGKTIILLFEKPSLRTRVTFEVGPGKMGAKTIFFDHSKERVGARESVKDYGRNLERWVDCIVARVFSQDVLEELAANCAVPVINALSDSFHPCQALADYFTLAEKLGAKQGVKAGLARLRGFRLAYIGDGNNVCASLMHGAAKLGVQFTVICPKGYQPEPAVIEEARAMAGASGGTITISHDPGAIKGAQAVYTDTWVSMGDEAEKVKRMSAFAKFRVDEKLMDLATNGASGGPAPFFMHCLPAHRGAEVTDAVIDSPSSIVYDQAENRMHVQNALLLHMLGGV